MQLRGQYLLPASPERVWNTLLDPATLQHCLPGCQELRPVAPDEYEATLHIGVATIRGVYRGKVRVAEKQPINSFRLEVQGGGNVGNVAASGRIELDPAEGKTLVRYDGEYNVAGTIAGIGQRLFQPVAQSLVTQFFRCVEQVLAES